MDKDDDFCIRNFEITLDSDETVELKFYQRLESDVNGVIWDASLVLASFILKLHQQDPITFRNKNLIELGAGVGCPGLTTACLGANTVLTDLEENLELLKINVEKNEITISKLGNAVVKPLNWSNEEATALHKEQKFDYILLSDCVYYEESIRPLIETLEVLCDSDSVEVLICQELRESKKQIDFFKEFLRKLSKLFTLKEIPFSEHNEECRSEDIVIYSCRKNDCQTLVPFI